MRIGNAWTATADEESRAQIGTDRITLAALDAASGQLMSGTPATLLRDRAKLDAALTRRSTFENGLKKTYPAYYDLLHPAPGTSTNLQHTNLQHILRDDEVMLSYDVPAGKSVLFVVTHDQLATVALPGSAALTASVTQLRTHIGKLLADLTGGQDLAAAAADDMPGFIADSHALYEQLFPASVTPLISGKKLIIIPSGSLYEMPWEAFVTQTSGADPQYLLDDHAISYIPSGSLLALVRVTSRKLTQHRAPLLAFANPAYDDTGTAAIRGAFDQLRFDALRDDAGGGFSALPGSESEAYEVRDALKAGDDSVIEGEAATKAHVLALNKTHQLAQYRYLLFATHAVLPNDVQGINQPALVLAHPSHDGFLTMGEIFGLSLDADFVALSACNTGEGARQPGEGISGMTRAFLYAGTPAISVTLWEVDDQAAAQITPAFFRWNDHWAFGG